MKLVKMNESVNRSFSGKTATEELVSVGYDIVENDSVVGSANISQGGYLSVNVSNVWDNGRNQSKDRGIVRVIKKRQNYVLFEKSINWAGYFCSRLS